MAPGTATAWRATADTPAMVRVHTPGMDMDTHMVQATQDTTAPAMVDIAAMAMYTHTTRLPSRDSWNRALLRRPASHHEGRRLLPRVDDCQRLDSATLYLNQHRTASTFEQIMQYWCEHVCSMVSQCG